MGATTATTTSTRGAARATRAGACAVIALLSLHASAARAAELDPSQARALSSLLAAGAARDPRVDALAQSDLRVALELEAARQEMSCDTQSQSCIAELASAMGASLVLYAELGQLGDALLISVSLFDSTTGTSAGRRVVTGVTSAQLAQELADAAATLVGARLAARPPPGDTRLRVLVLDIRAATTAGGAGGSAGAGAANGALLSRAPSAPMPWTLIGAGAAGGVGGIALVVAVALDQAAVTTRRTAGADASLSQVELAQRLEDGDAAGYTGIACYAVAGVLLLGAGALTIAHFVAAGAE